MGTRTIQYPVIQVGEEPSENLKKLTGFSMGQSNASGRTRLMMASLILHRISVRGH